MDAATRAYEASYAEQIAAALARLDSLQAQYDLDPWDAAHVQRQRETLQALGRSHAAAQELGLPSPREERRMD